jgi:hypothetical protein
VDRPAGREAGASGAEGDVCAKFSLQYPTPWYASRRRERNLFPAHKSITIGSLFSGLPKESVANFFKIFDAFHMFARGFGCYIEFSGFSTSRVAFTQEYFLNTTYVTADTAAHPEQTIKQG